MFHTGGLTGNVCTSPSGAFAHSFICRCLLPPGLGEGILATCTCALGSFRYSSARHTSCKDLPGQPGAQVIPSSLSVNQVVQENMIGSTTLNTTALSQRRQKIDFSGVSCLVAQLVEQAG